MSPSRTVRAVLGSALLATALLPLSAAAAPAAESPAPSVVVSPTSGLDRAGETVSVTVSGVPEGKGIYLQWCPDNPAGTRWPSGTCASSPQVWASSSPTAQGMGAQPLSASPFSLALTPTIATGPGTTDCRTTGCAVFVRLDHYSPGDTSLDRFIPVAFAAEPTPTPTPTPTETTTPFGVEVAPTTGLDPAGDEVSVTVTGLAADAGIYVRLCALAGSARPGAADCDGQGRWVRETYPYGPYPTDGSVVKPSAGAFTLPVAAAFGSVDCSAVACGIHVRRDHLAPADTSFDLAIPVTFAAASPSPSASPTPSTSPTPTLRRRPRPRPRRRRRPRRRPRRRCRWAARASPQAGPSPSRRPVSRPRRTSWRRCTRTRSSSGQSRPTRTEPSPPRSPFPLRPLPGPTPSSSWAPSPP